MIAIDSKCLCKGVVHAPALTELYCQNFTIYTCLWLASRDTTDLYKVAIKIWKHGKSVIHQQRKFTVNMGKIKC